MLTESISSSSWFFLPLILYVGATIFFYFRVIFDKTRFALWALRLLIPGIFIHITLLVLRFISIGYPFLMTSFESSQLMSLVVILIYIGFSLKYRFVSMGLFLLPASLVFYILSLTHVVAFNYPGHFLSNPWAFIHLVFIFMALGIFLVSFVTGFLYLAQEYQIKNKHLDSIFERFPSLATLDQIHYKALYLGFILFTFGLITGGGWAKSIYGVYITGDKKQIISLLIWIFFALILNFRVSQGWIGRKGILLSSVGFIAALSVLSWSIF